MRSRAPGRSPAKIAMAVTATIEARAGTGSMKKVTGTRSAVAIVAESPGIAPMKRPKAPARAMTVRTYGSRINWKACANTCMEVMTVSAERSEKGVVFENSPGQRYAEEMTEYVMDGACRDHGDQDGRHHMPPA